MSRNTLNGLHSQRHSRLEYEPTVDPPLHFDIHGECQVPSAKYNHSLLGYHWSSERLSSDNKAQASKSDNLAKTNFANSLGVTYLFFAFTGISTRSLPQVVEQYLRTERVLCNRHRNLFLFVLNFPNNLPSEPCDMPAPHNGSGIYGVVLSLSLIRATNPKLQPLATGLVSWSSHRATKLIGCSFVRCRSVRYAMLLSMGRSAAQYGACRPIILSRDPVRHLSRLYIHI